MILVMMNGIRLAKETPCFWLRSIVSFMDELIPKISEGIKMERQDAFLFSR
jgi:hypothetical protein